MAKQLDHDAIWERELRAIGLAISELEQWAVGGHREGAELTEVRFLLDRDNRTSVLCILKGSVEGEAVVGFVGGRRLTDTVLAAADKLRAEAVKWREDRPWNPTGSA